MIKRSPSTISRSRMATRRPLISISPRPIETRRRPSRISSPPTAISMRPTTMRPPPANAGTSPRMETAMPAAGVLGPRAAVTARRLRASGRRPRSLATRRPPAATDGLRPRQRGAQLEMNWPRSWTPTLRDWIWRRAKRPRMSADALRRIRDRRRAGRAPQPGCARSARRPRTTASWPPRTAPRRRTTAASRQKNLPQRASTISPGRCSAASASAPSEREMDRTLRSGEGLVVAYIDVDGLKAVNDTAGHTAGDTLLSSVADSITHDLRSYDVICRFGGDEFLVLARRPGHRRRARPLRPDPAAVERHERCDDHCGLCGTKRRMTRSRALIGRADAALVEARATP